MSFRNTLKTILRPCLINLVGVNSLRDCQDKFKCKSLINEDTSERCTVTEVDDENYEQDNLDRTFRSQFNHEMDSESDFYLLFNEANPQANLLGDPLVNPPNWLLEDDYFEEEIRGLFLSHFLTENRIRDVTFSFAVSINGEMVIKQAFKYQDRETLRPAKEDMAGAIGSITKTFTALMIMKLIEKEEALSESESENSLPHKRQRFSESDEESASESDEEFTSESDEFSRITLDSYVEDILTPDIWPEHFVQGETDGQKCKHTLRELFHHITGIKGNSVNTKHKYFQFRLVNLFTNYDEGDLKKSIEHIKCADIPRTDGINYSNYAYQLLALMYEKRTGRSFVEDLRDELAKMGLYDTDFDYKEGLYLDRLRTYSLLENVQHGARSFFTNPVWFEASYGLRSTLDDLIKYGNIIANCLLNERNPATHPIGHEKIVEMMTDRTPPYSNQRRRLHSRIICRAIGWEYSDQGFVEEEGLRDGYTISTYAHGGSTSTTQTSLAIADNSSQKTENGMHLQKKPLMYPLGEQNSLRNDVVVGALIVDGSCDQINYSNFLLELMDLILFKYRGEI